MTPLKPYGHIDLNAKLQSIKCYINDRYAYRLIYM